jgi:hypothetical protein
MMKLIGSALGAIGGAIPAILRDLAGLAGAGAIAYGAWLIHEPAGFIAGGVLLVCGALLAGRNAA